METTKERRLTAFRLRVDLVERLKQEARRENRSLNNYVETILMDAAYCQPNAETLEAIEEARSGKFAGVVDTSTLEAFIKSIEG